MTSSVWRLLKKAWGVSWDTVSLMGRAQISTQASALAYTTMLSLIPLLALSFAIFKFLGGEQKIQKSLQAMVIQHLTEGSGTAVMGQLTNFLGRLNVNTIGIFGLVGLILTSIALLTGAERAILRVWGDSESRSWIKRFLIYMLLISLGPLSISIVLGLLSTYGSFVLSSRLFPSGLGFGISLLVFFALVYKWVPKTRVQWHAAFAGAAFTVISWMVARVGFKFYVQKFVRYDRIYGSLATIPIFILWLWLLWMIVLVGAAVTASTQNRRLI